MIRDHIVSIEIKTETEIFVLGCLDYKYKTIQTLELLFYMLILTKLFEYFGKITIKDHAQMCGLCPGT
jgi:hypothetical protein